MLPDLGKRVAYLKFARLRPLVQELYYGEHKHGSGGTILSGERRNTVTPRLTSDPANECFG
jgi:hypothetical protein